MIQMSFRLKGLKNLGGVIQHGVLVPKQKQPSRSVYLCVLPKFIFLLS